MFYKSERGHTLNYRVSFKKGIKHFDIYSSRMSGMEIIDTLDRIQDDLESMYRELSSIISDLSPKIKEPEKRISKKSGFLVWNSFLDLVKNEMESDGSQVKYDDLVKKALELKRSNPESYKLFSETWTP